jgi:hypothetical protein
MDLRPSVPPTTLFAPLAASAFGSTGVELRAIAPQATDGLIQNATFNNASPSQFGMQTNKSIVYHCSALIGESASRGFLPVAPYSPGALLFSWRSPRALDFDETGCPERSRRVMDLMDVNKVMREKPASFEKFSTSEELARQLSFAGVLKTSITDSARERSLGTSIINNVVGQRASVVNVWGYDLCEGMKTYVIVKKKSTVDGANPVWTLTPYVGTFVTVEALEYQEGTETKIGTPIFIGTVMSPPSVHAEGCESLIDDPVRSTRIACYAGGVDVCLGV